MDVSLGACSGVLWDLAAVDWGLLRRRLSGRSRINVRLMVLPDSRRGFKRIRAYVYIWDYAAN